MERTQRRIAERVFDHRKKSRSTFTKECSASIRNAKEDIILSTFAFQSDESGKLILGALHDAADRGVCSSVSRWNGELVDMEGNRISMDYLPIRMLKLNCIIHNLVEKPWKMMGRMHDKYLIADGKKYILGGRNTYNYFLGDFLGHKNYDRDVLVVCDEPGERKKISATPVVRVF